MSEVHNRSAKKYGKMFINRLTAKKIRSMLASRVARFATRRSMSSLSVPGESASFRPKRLN